MWESIARFVLKNKLVLLLILALLTAFMGWQASKVQISYEFTKAIPTDNPRYISYQRFHKQFGDDGNTIVIGVQSAKLFDKKTFEDFAMLGRQIKNIKWVENVLSIPVTVTLVKDSGSQQLRPKTYLRRLIHQRLFYNSVITIAARAFFSRSRFIKMCCITRKPMPA